MRIFLSCVVTVLLLSNAPVSRAVEWDDDDVVEGIAGYFETFVQRDFDLIWRRTNSKNLVDPTGDAFSKDVRRLARSAGVWLTARN